ncbi:MULTISPECIES: homogentisate 1,2-dioxygenase [unclassified Wenzhouxiangella]|uniref:homogentisate 1,2-dioxygenase n=1 Tax=unclassified Wenzhouxiangella TaxID=2613841 RepID=UPI000E32ACB1|nr:MULTISPECIES: homogentisate 1,2-dioxygenase [unclassified Wenzhouxiangella]RFF27602.1 homogentisate 1,2-dioxygenase [Wenzhouxiangella sp. 15181]RFP70127.1 homogentisate 1,2-dioxygenase [Wenzhouxiangella sp. 15190]
MKKWISHSKVEGRASRQAHTNLPEGTYEREMGKEGFFGPAVHFYHTHMPTGWTDFEGPLQPRAFDTTKLDDGLNSPWQAAELLSNAHCKFRCWHSDGKMDHLVRNGDGDELLFIHDGAGELFCDFGHLSFRDGDYIMLPRGTMWRIESDAPVEMLLIEATNSSYMLPEKGLVGPHAIFDPAILDSPEIDDAFRDQQGEDEWKVHVKRRQQVSTITYPFNPLDAVGWKGDLMPVRINWRDIRPLMSHRYHLPPSAHTTFVAHRFVICTFTPRPFESDEDALKVPFFHNNDDYDEVLFYHAGNFFSRDNIHPGMMTHHPCGFTHGPHPKAMNNAFTPKKDKTEEVAVMLDTRDALDVTDDAEKIEWTGYVDSWKPKD